MDQTIFYPQGGGQPFDTGVINQDGLEFIVKDVRQVADEIRHYIANDAEAIIIGQPAQCMIDQARRILNSRYHTAAHLLGNAVEKIAPLKAIKGHSFPKEAYVEFQGEGLPDIDALKLELQNAILNKIATKIFETDQESFEREYYKLPYEIPANKKFRVMRIGDYLPVPCGGTHLASCDELVEIEIGKIKSKNQTVRVSYELL